MSEPVINVIIGPDCRESFLPLPAAADHPLQRAGVRMAGLSRLRPPYRIVRPTQNMVLLMGTLNGRGSYRIGGREGAFLPGTLWLIGGEQRVEYAISGRQWDIFWFHLRPQPAASGALRALAFPPLLPALMQGYLEESARSPAACAGCDLLYAQLLERTLARLLTSDGANEPFPGLQEVLLLPGASAAANTCAGAGAAVLAGARQLQAIWEAVEARPEAEWNVEALAHLAHLSAPHLHRLCRRQYGRSPMELVTALRMRRAQRRLSLPDCKLETLAAEVGYSTAFSFSRAFKKFCGMSPSDFRSRRLLS